MNTIVTIKESNTEVNDVNYEMKEVNTLEQEDDWYLDQITDDLIDTWEVKRNFYSLDYTY